MPTIPGAGSVGVVLGSVTLTQPLPPLQNIPGFAALMPGGAPAPTGVQAPPEIRKWAYGGSVTAPKAQGPGIGIVLIGIGAVFLFMFTRKKRRKK